MTSVRAQYINKVCQDYVRVVRCKDCEYRNNPLACAMESEGMHTTDDWFCASGIPKDGGK